jgi:hypothetical protein
MAMVGLVVILIGLLQTDFTNQKLSVSRTAGVFTSVLNVHSPAHKIEMLSCPMTWSEGKSDAIRAAIHNSTDKVHTYTVIYWVYNDFPSYHEDQPTSTLMITVPPQASQTIATDMIEPASKGLYQFTLMFAYADDDLADTATNPYWPLSYRGFCGVPLLNSPAYQSLRNEALLSLALLLLGLGLVVFIFRSVSGWKRLVVIVLGLFIIITEVSILVSILGPPAL